MKNKNLNTALKMTAISLVTVFCTPVWAAEMSIDPAMQVTTPVKSADSQKSVSTTAAVKAASFEAGPLSAASDVPAGWTVAKSNSNYAFKVEDTGAGTYGVSTLKLLNVRTGVQQTVDSWGNYRTNGTPVYSQFDISFSGGFIIYARKDASSTQATPILQSMTRPDLKTDLSLFMPQTAGAPSLSFNNASNPEAVGQLILEANSSALPPSFDRVAIDLSNIRYDGPTNMTHFEMTKSTLTYHDKAVTNQKIVWDLTYEGGNLKAAHREIVEATANKKMVSDITYEKPVNGSKARANYERITTYINGVITELATYQAVSTGRRETHVYYVSGKLSRADDSYYNFANLMTRKIVSTFNPNGTFKTRIDIRYAYRADGTQYVAARYNLI